MRKVKVSLSVIELKEDDIYFVYSPALALTGYDRTKISYFLEYTIENQALEAELKRLSSAHR